MIRPQDIYKVIVTFGQTLTLSKAADGTYDPATGSFTQTDNAYTVIGYFYNYRDSDTDQLIFGNRKLIISGKNLSVAPEVGDKVSGVGDTVVIQSVKKTYDKGNVLLYICGVND